MTASVQPTADKGTPTRRQASHAVYLDLKRQILQLHLAPGARLVLDDLAERYCVSAMPIRQALTALELDELVETEHHRGARVAPLSVSQLEVIQSVRLGLESRLTRLGVQSIGKEGLEDIRKQMTVLERFTDLGDHRGFVETSWQLRDVLYSAADRPRLFAMAVDYRCRYERYLFALTAPSDLDHHLATFRKLQAACEAGDAMTAERITADSVEWTLARLTTELETRGRFTS